MACIYIYIFTVVKEQAKVIANLQVMFNTYRILAINNYYGLLRIY